MGDAVEQPSIDYETYLTLEREADQKHEWLNGQIYARAGGPIEHGQLTTQMIGELLRLASACGCRVYSSDVKIRVQATGLATYPDASVVCGPVERDPGDRNAIVNPVVLVEVLSDGTEAYDRGDKFAHYRQIPSLRDVVLISQHEARVELCSRDERGRWVLSTAGVGERFSLTAMDGPVEVDRIYAAVRCSGRSAIGSRSPRTSTRPRRRSSRSSSRATGEAPARHPRPVGAVAGTRAPPTGRDRRRRDRPEPVCVNGICPP